MTSKQNAAVALIARTALEHQGTLRESEFKEWEVTEYPSFVAVRVVTGYINDEGTMLSVVGRSHGHFFVGVRGGIETKTINRHKAAERKRNPLIFGFSS